MTRTLELQLGALSLFSAVALATTLTLPLYAFNAAIANTAPRSRYR